MRIRGKLVAGLIAVSTMVACLISGPVLAGGDYYSSPPPASSGRTIWEGFHFGVHGGYADNDYGISQTLPASPLVTRSDSDDGFVGGLVYGSSWQFGNFVLGTDSVWSFGDVETGANVAANGTAATADVNYTSETRLRGGILVQPNILVYGTLGIARAEIEVNGTLIAGGNNDESVFGFAYGGGVEATMNSRWFARLEYIHTDYEDENFREVGGGALNVDLDSDVVRGAVGYRFDWSPLDLIRGR